MSAAGDDWLAVREVQDGHSRSRELAVAFARFVDVSDCVVDLACGTGSNYRYLRPLLHSEQQFLCVDNDAIVLNEAQAMTPHESVRFERRDLAGDLDRVPSGPGFVATASAFLDITSPTWLDALAMHFRDTPLLVAMSASGNLRWEPEHHADEAVEACLQEHRRSDFGFGDSLGTEAAGFLADRLRSLRCDVTMRQTDWHLDAKSLPLIEMMVGGVTRRLRAMGCSVDVDGWEMKRCEQLRGGALRLTVPHVDLLSVPPRLN